MSAAPSDNAGQAEFWNGPTGAVWAEEAARIDRAFTPFTEALLRRAAPRPGEAALDLGCGGGEIALAVATALGPSGRVAAVDLSRPMLALAARREAALRANRDGVAPITWLEADASEADPGTGFDLLVSRFGSMFFAEPASAFRRLRAALKPDGRAVLLCWQDARANLWASGPVAAVGERFGAPEPTTPGTPGPFAFADTDRVLAILASAGFRHAEAEPVLSAKRVGVAGPGRTAIDDAVDYLTRIGPLSRLLRDRPEIRQEALAIARDFVARFERDGAVALPAACWLYTARA